MKPPIKYMHLSYYPLGDTSQFFGENPDLYAKFNMKGHNGIDLVRPWGEPLYAIEDGEIVAVENNPLGYGKHVRLLSKRKNKNGYYNEWVYGHNSENLVYVGQQVRAGDKIALMGNTGFTVSGDTPYWQHNPFAGTHVHLGLRQAVRTDDGFSYANSSVKLKIVDYNNGYKGSIDPVPFLLEVEDKTTMENKKLFRQILTIRSLLNKLKLL